MKRLPMVSLVEGRDWNSKTGVTDEGMKRLHENGWTGDDLATRGTLTVKRVVIVTDNMKEDK